MIIPVLLKILQAKENKSLFQGEMVYCFSDVS